MASSHFAGMKVFAVNVAENQFFDLSCCDDYPAGICCRYWYFDSAAYDYCAYFYHESAFDRFV